MKRGPFLTAASAAVLTGCGGGHGAGILPGIGRQTPQQAASRGALQLVPQKADPISAAVLASPIIGEARRFDGTVIPRGWLLMQGQTLPAGQYPQLASILSHAVAIGKQQSFTLPAVKYGAIIAAAGVYPSSPKVLVASHREFSAEASLGPGARRAPMRALSPRAEAVADARAAAVRDAQRLFASAPRPRFGVPGELSADLAARIRQSRADTRTSALGALSAVNRERAESLVDAVASGRISTHEAQVQIAGALSAQEATTVLGIHDAQQRAFRPEWTGMEHPDVQGEAGRFIIDITFTPDQLRRFAQLPGNQ